MSLKIEKLEEELYKTFDISNNNNNIYFLMEGYMKSRHKIRLTDKNIKEVQKKLRDDMTKLREAKK